MNLKYVFLLQNETFYNYQRTMVLALSEVIYWVFYIINIMVQNKTFRKSCTTRLGFIILARYSATILSFAIFYAHYCELVCSMPFLRIVLLNILKRLCYWTQPWAPLHNAIALKRSNFVLRNLLFSSLHAIL
jgi:hypothetical protein